MESSNLVVGKRYWYRWSYEYGTCSGLLIGLTETNALFEYSETECRVVPLISVHCEDTRVIVKKPSFFRMW